VQMDAETDASARKCMCLKSTVSVNGLSQLHLPSPISRLGSLIIVAADIFVTLGNCLLIQFNNFLSIYLYV
jgi:hypothetical protein